MAGFHKDWCAHAIDHSKTCTCGLTTREELITKVITGQSETVNHLAHYGGDTPYESIKVIEAWELGFCLGNAVKYISRAGKKDPAKTLEDLKKAHWYLDREIAKLEGTKK